MRVRSTRVLFVLVVTAQILLLMGFAAGRMTILARGEPALLLSQPIDPYHITMGNYVQLSYELNRVPWDEGATDIADPDALPTNRQVYVIWAQDGKYHHAVPGLYLKRPSTQENQIAVRAQLKWYYSGIAHVEYGVERFFVPDGEGQRIEKPGNTVEVEVRVGRQGTPAIYRVFLNGEELPFN